VRMHPPVGAAILQQCACPAIVRLRVDPTQLPPGTMSRQVEVSWRRRGTRAIATLSREVGWSGLAHLDLACEQLSIARNEEYLTEGAAIAVAALLIHDLEEGSLQNVLPNEL
jgi:hypothetical protein